LASRTTDVSRNIEELRFAVVGAYVADCLISLSRLPVWDEECEAHSIRTAPGGKALNQAVALARLGTQVVAIGAVGDDGLGRDVLTALTSSGIDVSNIQVRERAATSVCVCFVGNDGQTSFVWHIDESVAVTKDTVRRAEGDMSRCDAALITFELPLSAINETIRLAHGCGAKVFVNPAPPLAVPSDAASIPWDQVDVLVPNEAEGRIILTGIGNADSNRADDLAQELSSALAVPTVVVTLGESGCVAYSAGKTLRYPARPATPVDTTGASDAFTATLAAYLTGGAQEEEAIQAASAAAAWSVGRPGGYESMPTRAVL
jgi:ribokinase